MNSDQQRSPNDEVLPTGATENLELDQVWNSFDVEEKTFPGTGPIEQDVGARAASEPPIEPPIELPGGQQSVAANPLQTIEAATQAARDQGALLPGSSFGVYVVGECIGEGGMARIYRAEHAGLRRQVALKVLLNGFSKDAEGRERFVREARLAAAIKHPNVVNIFDVGVFEEIPYLVMELLRGKDLECLIQEQGPLEERLIVDIMVPVVAGLAAVHDAGIVHRDLKPGNIFLSKGRFDEIEPKLLDFGISKGSGPDPLKLTSNGLMMGTPLYMSPEGVSGEEMTTLSDQYSLGVVLYECATGASPFTAANLPELVRTITDGKFSPLAEHSPKVSARLISIIERAMSLVPHERYADMRELGRDLLQLAEPRARVTYGLTFGMDPTGRDASPTQEGTSRLPSIAPLAASVPPPASEPNPFRPKSAARRLAFGAVILSLVALGASLLKTEPAVHTASVAAGAADNSAPLEPAPLRVDEATPLEPSPSASPSANAGTGQREPQVVPVPMPPEANAAPRRRVVLAAAPQRASNVRREAAPAWALPPASAVSAKPRGDVGLTPGTNGAPIFD